MHRTLLLTLTALLILSTQDLGAQTLHVRHDHDPWGSCEGELEITEDGIRFTPQEGDHQREWPWIDIQSFDRKAPDEFSLLTYEDLRWHLGLDRAFDFRVLPGSAALDTANFDRIRDHLAHPVVDRISEAVEPIYQVSVKHLHVLGGCEGILTFGQEKVTYDTSHAEDARTWDIVAIRNVWSSDPFQLELRVLEEDRRSFSKTRVFNFQLKEPLDTDYYDTLRRQRLLAP